MAECLNSCLRDEQKLPIVTLIEKTRTKLADFFSTQAGEYPNNGLVTSWLLSMLQELQEKCREMTFKIFAPAIVWSTPLRWYPVTLTSRHERAVVNDGKSLVFHPNMC